MMHFKKNDLKMTHYKWSHEARMYEGPPSRRTFDPANGAQVLFLINHYALFDEQLHQQQLLWLEQLLYNGLPLEARSELSVWKWMLDQPPGPGTTL